MKEKNFELLPIPEIQPAKKPKASPQPADQPRSTKMNFTISFALIEKLKDYAYWEGLTQQEVVTNALGLFLKDKKVKSRPEALKKRPRPGRKPKQG